MDKKYQERISKAIKSSILENEKVKKFNDKITLPDLDSMKLNEIDSSYVSKILENAKTKSKGEYFYEECPPVSYLGYHESEKVYLLTADYKKQNSTSLLTFSIDSVENKDNREHIKQVLGTTSDGPLCVSLVGVPNSKYINLSTTAKIPAEEFEKMEKKSFKNVNDFINSDIYLNSFYDGTDNLEFLKIDNKLWVQYSFMRNKDNSYSVDLTTLKEDEDNVKVTEKIGINDYLTSIGMANPTFYIMLDSVHLNKSTASGEYSIEEILANTPSYWTKELIKFIQSHNSHETNNYNANYNTLGCLSNNSFIGTVYANSGDRWVNLNKLILYKSNLNPSFTVKDISSAFKLDSYNDLANYSAKKESEALLAEFDDRWKIQKELFNKNEEALKKWTVTIGDCTFYIPPTSIRITTNTVSDREPLLRARGSAIKSNANAERFLHLSLYFGGDKQINGKKIDANLPAGQQKSYYMNGLRTLISQFKFCPFAPIENEYINKVLNISAVSYTGLQFSTVNGYPRLIAAELTLQEFNYNIYMPEIPFDPNFSDDINYFSSVISFPTMRWYYQRAIQKGEEINNYDFSSDEFISAVNSGKTFLTPFDFTNNNMVFYIPNNNDLQTLLNAKIAKLKSNGKVSATLGDEDSANYQALRDLTKIKSIFSGMLKDTASKEALYTDWNKYFSESLIQGAAITKNFKNNKGIDSFLSMQDFRIRDNFTEKGIEVVSTEKLIKYDYEAYFIGLRIKIKMPYVNILDDIDGLRSMIANKLGISKTEILKDFCLDIYFNDIENSIGYKITEFCEAQELNESEIANNIGEELEDKSEDIYNNMTYEPVPLSNVVIETASCYIGNTTSRINLLSQQGFAQQYMGGQDTIFEFVLTTKDETDINRLQALQRLSEAQIKNYHAILTCWPLKLNSSITKFMGTTDVSIESIDISTVPEFPELYKINIKIISVNRNLRNAEALKRIESENQEYLKTNGGYNGIGNENNYCIKSFFDIQNSFAKAEIYPDLELPTIEEISETGLYFLKQPNDKTRVFVDPDFYFVYAHVRTSEIMRESINNTFKEATGEDTDLSNLCKDKYGNEFTVSPSKYTGTTTTPINDRASFLELEAETMKKAMSAKKEEDLIRVKTRNDKKLSANILDVIDNSNLIDIWSPCSKIQCLFMEKDYKDILTNGSLGEKWLKDVNENTNKAIDSINNYLSRPIGVDGLISSNTHLDNYLYSSMVGPLTFLDSIKDEFDNASVHNAFKLTGLDDVYKFFNNCSSDIAYVVFSAACAMTAIEDYSGNKNNKNWYPRNIGVSTAVGFDTSSNYSTNIEGCVETGKQFGLFGFKMYTREELSRITGEDIKSKTGSTVNEKLYLLDPFYRYKDSEEVEEYKRKCITSNKFACAAFFRIIMYWYKKLLENKCFPNVIMDVLKEQALVELNSLDYTKKCQEDNLDSNNSLSEEEKNKKAEEINKTADKIESYKQFLKTENRPTDTGKIFAATVLAITEGYEPIFNMIKENNYGELNNLTTNCLNSSTFPEQNKFYVRLRRFLNAFVGTGLISTKEEMFEDKIVMPASEFDRLEEDQKYIEASEDPNTCFFHSFNDMIVHDSRGRMLRAFPTFYVVLIDEGRDIGTWKLHDNFYTTNSISDITITRSREMPADTASIVMTNMFNTIADEDSYGELNNYNYSLTEAYESIFCPEKVYRQEESKRNELDKPYVRSRIRSGARIHIRMGYGSNAANLPIVFNGAVSEVGVNEIIQVVAQGDGIELMNPILDSEGTYAQNESNKDKWVGSRWFFNFFNHSETPRTILNHMFLNKGGCVANVIKNATKGTFYNENIYGIKHFGVPEFDEIVSSGEPTQNIFEGTDKPCWGNDEKIESMHTYDKNDCVRVSFKVPGKTVWDVINICASASPDFIVGVTPFGMRSTLFHGLPKFYYAYDYYKDDKGVIKERRKPYRQSHIYMSSSDIIMNNISTSEKYVKTVAVGKYRTFYGESSTSPIYVDFDIYPENQKTMIVDTQFHSGCGESLVDKFVDNKGSISAQRYNAINSCKNALRWSIGSMYQGDLIVFGDTTVKPHDRIIIKDDYNGMTGQALVREVVTHFGSDSGFISSIYPDCNAVIEDKTELAINNLCNDSAVKSTAISDCILGISSSILPYIGQASASLAATKTITNAIATAVKSSKFIKLLPSATAIIGSTPQGVAAAAILATTATIGSYVGNKARQLVDSLQVLTIIPLKRFNKVYTAGLNGSMGVIVGSPTYDLAGPVDKITNYVFKDHKSFLGNIWDGTMKLFLPSIDEIRESADKLIKVDSTDYKNISPSSGGIKLRQTILNNDKIIDTYSNILLKTRAKSKQDFYESMQHYSIKKESDLFTENHKLRDHLKLITSNSVIQEFMKKKFFKILQDEPSIKDKLTLKTIKILDGGSIKTICGYKIPGRESFTYPILKEECLLLLIEILTVTYSYIPEEIRRDPEKMKYLTVFLKSAIWVGGNWVNTTGITFCLSCVGNIKNKNYTLEAMKKAADFINNNLKKRADFLGVTDIESFKLEFYEREDEAHLLYVSMKLENKVNPDKKVKETTNE